MSEWVSKVRIYAGYRNRTVVTPHLGCGQPSPLVRLHVEIRLWAITVILHQCRLIRMSKQGHFLSLFFSIQSKNNKLLWTSIRSSSSSHVLKNCPFSQVLAPPENATEKKPLTTPSPPLFSGRFLFHPWNWWALFLLFFLLDFTNALFYLDYTITFWTKFRWTKYRRTHSIYRARQELYYLSTVL